VNASFLVGHCALRRYVLGPDFERDTTPEERAGMGQLLDRSLVAGGLGLSTSRSSTRNDGAGRPVPSRFASEEELRALCEVVGRHDGMSLALISEGCLNRFSDHEVEYLARLTEVARAPINWNALGVTSEDPGRVEHQLRPSRRARELGGRIAALTMPVHADIVVFDPERIEAGPTRISHDLPGNAKRLLADPRGVALVLVNGRETIVDGDPTGDLPGTLLRSGRDTSAAARFVGDRADGAGERQSR
jgi:N-acyl-D-aspartate/D-glutamate deacylase